MDYEQLTETERKARLAEEIARKRVIEPLPVEASKADMVTWVSRFPLNIPLDKKFELAANIFVEQAIKEADKVKPQAAMVSAAIAVEKMMLLRGLPTEITGSVSILIKIGERAADEGITLKQVLTAVLENM